MPVDFSKLPPKQPVPDNPPSRLLWTAVFFVIVIAGIFAVLLLWPKGEPTQTPWFWTCLIVYPIGVATFVVLRRYSMYEGRRLDAIAWNDACEQYEKDIFDRASIPVDILASAYRFSNDSEENELGGLLSGSLKLEPQVVPAPDTPPVSARWFTHPDSDERGNKHTNDNIRQRDVLRWVFGELLNDVAEAVGRLPDDLKLSTQLVLSDTAMGDESLQCWNRLWADRKLRSARTSIVTGAMDMMWLDAWLDRISKRQDQEARLVVFVRLYPLLENAPPAGSSEAAIAILLAPQSLTRQFRLTPVAQLHRPTRTDDPSIDVALTNALRWGRVSPTEVKRVWQTGLDAGTAGTATKAWVKVGIAVKPTNIDYMVGLAGDAAPWFAVACASKAASVENAPQLTVTGSVNGSRLCVVRIS
ncbi:MULTISPECIES: hypothetical protein [Paraburkholderia]|uniref:Uncharacterized protein n=1 Tax=Paraburkholderia tuberum TaxID=157910 RepID=A0A1H1JKL6_9BURK|nr:MULTISPECIES: hypothetical protein [Paraburkholderia]MBC8722531.1 hypothetical protein [Paraburkholderia sp. 31.1]SDR50514.1 hypothetical protein SAMN05445850_5078 [Paraburkholderia tuberum]